MMKRSTKRFTISSEAKNSQGFHVRTAGIDLSEFLANPLLLFMHKRPKGERQDEILPLGYWEDIKKEDGKVTGVPVFDTSDPFSKRIFDKVENGSIRMASAGLKPLEFAEPDGEKWLERSTMKEGSMVDIGSNAEALAVALYNDAGDLVQLADLNTENLTTSKTQNTMKILQLSESTIGLLKLAEGATEQEAHTAILNLVTLSTSQKSKIETLEKAKKTAEDALEAQVKLGEGAEMVTLLDQAEKVDRKITADQRPMFEKMNLADAKELLATMPVSKSVKDSIDTGAEDADETLLKMSYDELDKSGQLVTLKEQNFDEFKKKFKAKYGAEYKEKAEQN